jgi:hypothetical protein
VKINRRVSVMMRASCCEHFSGIGLFPLNNQLGSDPVLGFSAPLMPLNIMGFHFTLSLSSLPSKPRPELNSITPALQPLRLLYNPEYFGILDSTAHGSSHFQGWKVSFKGKQKHYTLNIPRWTVLVTDNTLTEITQKYGNFIYLYIILIFT